MSELKPCPFCGGEASIRREDDTWIVECKNHGWSDADEDGCRYAGDIGLYVRINGTLNHWTYEIVYLEKDVEAARLKAIAAWNRRAERTCQDVEGGDFFRCSKCGCEIMRVANGWKPLYMGDVNYCPNCGAKVVVE